jgi:signal transduction histidine kinase
MDKDKHILDFRDFKPTSVLVIDLVKHSKRSKLDIQAIQSLLATTFEETIKRLSIKDMSFNYTGDGYMVTFSGNSSTRILDFLNVVIPQLNQKLYKYKQGFRAGLDFGLVHMSINPLTKSAEHFDIPGIQAARLESSANENQILASETIYNLFHVHYPSMFGSASTLRTKDREIIAYCINTIDFTEIRQYFENLFFQNVSDSITPVGKRNKILFVDDEPRNLSMMIEWLKISQDLKGFIINTAHDGTEALKIFEPEKYALVVTDQLMPRMRGDELAEILSQLDNEVPIVMLTAYSSPDLAKLFFANGGTFFLSKPAYLDILGKVLRRSISINIAGELRNKLKILTDDIGLFIYSIQVLSETFDSIMEIVSTKNDLANKLLRHKAKQIILLLIETIVPGNNLHTEIEAADLQLKSVKRLLQAIGTVTIITLKKHIIDYSEDLTKLNPNAKIKVIIDKQYFFEDISDASVLTLVICELLDNSLAAMDGNGYIKVNITNLKSAQILQITVSDSGPGVSETIKNTMFELGVSTKGVGRGVGLCLVKEVVSVLNGQIKYDYNNGAVFTIRIPH